jgi:beta-glucuronidase
MLFALLCTEYIRPGGCKKGLFSRERQPKMAAHITRWRYWTLAHNSTNITLPNDLLFADSIV